MSATAQKFGGHRDDWPVPTLVAFRHEPKLALALRSAWAQAYANVQDTRLLAACQRAALHPDDLDEILASLKLTQASILLERAVVPHLSAAVMSGVEVAGAGLAAMGIPVRRHTSEPKEKRGPSVDLNAVNAEAVRWAQLRAAALVVADADMRAAIRALVVNSQANQVTVRDLAQQIKDIIGLDPRRMAAAAKFEGALKTAGVSEAEVVRRAGRYTEALRRQRALTVARTESISALAKGQQELWKQASRKGLIDAQTMRQKWITTDDDLLCPQCEFLDGLLAPLEGTWPGGVKSPPAHPNCRCATGLVRIKRAGA